MNTIILALVVGSIVLLSLNQVYGQENENVTYLTHNDKDLGYSIEYPSNWTLNHDYSEHHTVASIKPNEIENEGTGVAIKVSPRGDSKSIKDVGNTLKKSEGTTLLAYYRNSSTLLSGMPAFKMIYLDTYTPNLFEKSFGYKSSTSKAMMVATMVPEKESIFGIAYFANSPIFEKHLPEVEKMVKSFQIYGKGPIIQEDNDNSSSLNHNQTKE